MIHELSFQLDWHLGAIPVNVLNTMATEAGNKNNIGSYSFFCGQVRADEINSKNVLGIEYSAYPEMSEILLKEFVLHSNNSKSVMAVKVIHSLGFVAAGELSLILFIASAHRKELLSLQLELIEFLKFGIPVWKKEVFTDGKHRWIGV